jgi:hypothetical protein
MKMIKSFGLMFILLTTFQALAQEEAQKIETFSSLESLQYKTGDLKLFLGEYASTDENENCPKNLSFNFKGKKGVIQIDDKVTIPLNQNMLSSEGGVIEQGGEKSYVRLNFISSDFLALQGSAEKGGSFKTALSFDLQGDKLALFLNEWVSCSFKRK